MDQTTQKHSVLIVEDDPALHVALKDALTEAGFNAQVATDGQAGLDAALSAHPEVILLDINLPKMDGITMLKELRGKETEPKSRVLFFTNLASMDKVADALSEGAEGYIVKSETSLEDIVKKVNGMFNQESS